MLNRELVAVGLSAILVACGGKVVFVGSDDTEPNETTPIGDGGAAPDNGFCALFCESPQNACSAPRNDEACFEWCRERQTDSGKCADSWALQVECEQCSDCPYRNALPICALGCIVEPDCVEGPNQTTCRATCASDFEWTCTAGLPSTCTCVFNGEVIDTCSYDYEPAFIGCCEGVFAEMHL